MFRSIDKQSGESVESVLEKLVRYSSGADGKISVDVCRRRPSAARAALMQ